MSWFKDIVRRTDPLEKRIDVLSGQVRGLSTWVSRQEGRLRAIEGFLVMDDPAPSKGDGSQDPCRGMSILEAAEYVLRERGERMHHSEITDRAVELGYRSNARSPGNSFSATLYRETKLPGCPIRRDGRGLFSLRNN